MNSHWSKKTIIILSFLLIHSAFAVDLVTEKALGGLYPVYPTIKYGSGDKAKLIKRGEYLARIGNCIACHTDTENKGASFAGGTPINTPFGTLYGQNITSDKETGIGNWTNDDFINAMRHGKRPDGKNYFPVFPYPYYNKVSDDDLLAIKAYLDALPAAKKENKKHELPFPFSWRFLQYGWKTLFFYPHQGRYEFNNEKSSDWNRGAYYVEGLGHCAMCHTPINVLGAPKRKYHLTGSFIEGFWAPDITSKGLEIAPVEEVVRVFKEGRLIGEYESAVTGPMAEVHESMKKLNYKDLWSIALYLKTVVSKQPRSVRHAPQSKRIATGRRVYHTACSTCHAQGQVGAPIIGKTSSWIKRVGQGMGMLYRHSLYGLSP